MCKNMNRLVWNLEWQEAALQKSCRNLNIQEMLCNQPNSNLFSKAAASDNTETDQDSKNLKKRRFVSKMFKILCLLFNDMH